MTTANSAIELPDLSESSPDGDSETWSQARASEDSCITQNTDTRSTRDTDVSALRAAYDRHFEPGGLASHGPTETASHVGSHSSSQTTLVSPTTPDRVHYGNQGYTRHIASSSGADVTHAELLQEAQRGREEFIAAFAKGRNLAAISA
ncbi:uncharacterized protein I303_102440 [Kwoniella dejecticola CBS 10117]|uniref:Uncharacterized protein n=1 Tax=Kwoniella dejecticola CBS 10117 TaxID=1296121 RepID=A0AAJ8KLG7_9TREE